MSELRKIEQLAVEIYCKKYPVDHLNFKYWERMRDNFVKGYVGESLLRGSAYQDKTEELKKDIDDIASTLERISKAITNNLTEHQNTVHEEIVKKLESGSVPLDNAIEEFTKAMTLAKKCDESLKNAEEAITKLVNATGELEDFKVEE